MNQHKVRRMRRETRDATRSRDAKNKSTAYRAARSIAAQTRSHEAQMQYTHSFPAILKGAR